MTYEETVNTINNIRRFGNLSGVEITARVLETLHHPEQGMYMIHIAGTNGKGSVSAFLCEILRRSGMKVGVFTSPHLVDFRERICVNGDMITKEAVTRIGNMLLDTEFGVHPTMFDYCLAMAAIYFKEEQCDVAIWETGLGGRLDSTNALGVPDVSVITKIGFDHMAILGDTLTSIASEKAGIIKKGTRLIVESQESDVLQVLLAAANETKVKSCQVVELSEIGQPTYDGGMQKFTHGRYGEIQMAMLGVHQCENAVAAMMAAEAFFEAVKENGGENISQKEKNVYIREGIASTRWKGRMEILQTDPFFMVDGAHNSNGVEALKNSLQQLFPGEKFHFIMGVMADKDYETMVEDLLPLALDFVTVTVESERGLQAKELAAVIEKKGIRAQCSSLEECLPKDKRGEKTIAFGSLYFVGEIEAIYS